jgi:hypothetical protein
MVCFQTKNPNLGKFWGVLQWKMLVYFMDNLSIFCSFVIFYGHLVYFLPFGILYQEKSGNPVTAWSSGIVSTFGVLGREIESNQGIGLQ